MKLDNKLAGEIRCSDTDNMGQGCNEEQSSDRYWLVNGHKWLSFLVNSWDIVCLVSINSWPINNWECLKVLISIVDADGLVLKHQAINIHNTDSAPIVSYPFQRND